MRVTPLDVRKQEFRKSVRGFDQDEVRAFLTTVADEYEAVLIDNKQVRERIMQLEEKLAEFHSLETALRDTMMTAEKVLKEAKSNARKESELIVRSAELTAQQQRERYRAQAEQMRRDILTLHKEKEAYLLRFRGLAEAQIRFLDNHHQDFEEFDRLLTMAETTMHTSPIQPAHITIPEPTPESINTQEPRPHGPADIWRDYSTTSEPKTFAQESETSSPDWPAAEAEQKEPLAAATIDTDIQNIGSSTRENEESDAEFGDHNVEIDQTCEAIEDQGSDEGQDDNDQHQDDTVHNEEKKDWDGQPDTWNG